MTPEQAAALLAAHYGDCRSDDADCPSYEDPSWREESIAWLIEFPSVEAFLDVYPRWEHPSA